MLAVLGESGSGKSVTLRAIARLLPHQRSVETGEIRFEGEQLNTLSQKELSHKRARIGVIFQEPLTALDAVFPIGTQIAEAVVRHEGVSWSQGMARAREVLDMVRIPSAERRLKNYPHELSGGMRQRAMIASALACRPKLLLADEPTTALDVTVQIQILLLLRELQRELGMGVIFVTHDVGVAAEIADRVAVMYAGRIVEQGSAIDVLETPLHPYTYSLLHATVHGAKKGELLQVIEGSPPDMRALGDGCSFAPRCPRAKPQCEQSVPALKEVSEEGREGSKVACFMPMDTVVGVS